MSLDRKKAIDALESIQSTPKQAFFKPLGSLQIKKTTEGSTEIASNTTLSTVRPKNNKLFFSKQKINFYQPFPNNGLRSAEINN